MVKDILNLEDFVKEVKILLTKVNKLYIYGTGMYGQTVYKTLCKHGIKIEGFLETKKSKSFVLEHSVYNASEIEKKESGIILGLNQHNAAEVVAYLNEIGFNMDHVIDGCVTRGGNRSGFNEKPAISLTTVIGCRVNCNYCPQNLLVTSYFKENKNRIREMSVDIFKQCLNKLPQECSILFCGMSEPFLNSNCIELLEIAAESGRNIDLNTTLVGIDMETLRRVVELPIGFVTLHVADAYGYANIPLSEEYYEMVDFLINYRKANGDPFINLCNAQATPDERIQAICNNKYEILTTMHDRAGNLKDEKLLCSNHRFGSISCGLSGTKLNRNVLLPDGTLLLCDNDYGMKHVLGNLLLNDYEEIMNGEELQKIHEACERDDSDVLCRSCPFANVR